MGTHTLKVFQQTTKFFLLFIETIIFFIIISLFQIQFSNNLRKKCL